MHRSTSRLRTGSGQTNPAEAHPDDESHFLDTHLWAHIDAKRTTTVLPSYIDVFAVLIVVMLQEYDTRPSVVFADVRMGCACTAVSRQAGTLATQHGADATSSLTTSRLMVGKSLYLLPGAT